MRVLDSSSAFSTVQQVLYGNYRNACTLGAVTKKQRLGSINYGKEAMVAGEAAEAGDVAEVTVAGEAAVRWRRGGTVAKQPGGNPQAHRRRSLNKVEAVSLPSRVQVRGYGYRSSRSDLDLEARIQAPPGNGNYRSFKSCGGSYTSRIN